MNFHQILSAVLENHSQPELNSKLWDSEDLRPQILKRLCDIADDFVVEYDIERDAIEDVILTGSLANYNWTECSDIDIHLIVDFSQIHSDVDLVAEYYKLAKTIWNNDHAITICGHEVELYVQDSTEKHYSTGVYSLWDEDWLVKPKRGPDAIPDEKQIADKAEKYIDQIENLEFLGSDALESIRDLKQKIRTMRQSGLQSNGEYSLENLVFKKLRNEGYLKKLFELHKKSYDKQMSFYESVD